VFKDIYLIFDMGTTSVKVSLINKFGEIIGLVIKEYSLITPMEDIVELDPRDYWKYAVSGTRELLVKTKVPSDAISCIGVSSQGETLILLDKNGKEVRNAIVWMDNRSQKEADFCRERFGSGRSGLAEITPTWTYTKILWLKKNEPDIYKKTRKFILVEDYIIYKLSNIFSGEFSLYSTSYLLDIKNKIWREELFEYADLDTDQFPDLVESGEIVGNLTHTAAEELNLIPGIPVISGAMDQTAGMLGAGNIEENIITETTGAALVVCRTLNSIPDTTTGTLSVQPHAVAGKYLLTGWCPAGGMSLKWLRDTFFEYERKSLREIDPEYFKTMMDLAYRILPGSQGLNFYPFLTGPGILPVDQSSRGCFYGVELHHRKEHFIRSVIESIAYVLRENIELMSINGDDIVEIRSMGGGSNSNLWNQIKADVSGKPIVTMESGDTASLGIAILGTVALGVYPDIKAAVSAMVKIKKRFIPEEDHMGKYELLYNKYRSIEEKIFT